MPHNSVAFLILVGVGLGAFLYYMFNDDEHERDNHHEYGNDNGENHVRSPESSGPWNHASRAEGSQDPAKAAQKPAALFAWPKQRLQSLPSCSCFPASTSFTRPASPSGKSKDLRKLTTLAQIVEKTYSLYSAGTFRIKTNISRGRRNREAEKKTKKNPQFYTNPVWACDHNFTRVPVASRAGR